jgi:HAD superfamily hydrolase (TIGR01493 family)
MLLRKKYVDKGLTRCHEDDDSTAKYKYGFPSVRPEGVSEGLGLSRHFAGVPALLMLAERNARTITRAEATEMVNKMSSLPPHPEVASALARLRETTLKVVALTNSVQSVAEDQLTNAGIRGFFDDVMSADAVKPLKPAPELYRAVARALDVDTADVRLVAAHSWDVSGAQPDARPLSSHGRAW